MRQGQAHQPRDGGICQRLRWAALLLPVIVLLAAGARATPRVQAAQLTVTIIGANVTGAAGSFTITTSIGQVNSLSASASGAVCGTTPTFTWTFNGASIGTGVTLQPTFTTGGTGYVVASDGCGDTGIATFTVTIGGTTGTGACTPNPATGNPITVSMTASSTSAAVGQTVSFFGSANDIGVGAQSLSYTWNFGDGTTLAATQTTSHAYTAPNTYTVTATVADNLGRVNCGTTTVSITGTGTGGTSGSTNPRIQVAPNGPYTGAVNQQITFGGFATTQNAGATITNYLWSFGDGGSATGAAVQHAYTSAGTFTVTLTANDSAGQSSSNTTTATIGGSGSSGGSGSATTGQNSERGVTVNTGGPYTGSAGTAINFTGTATTTNGGATITSYVWAFGDGGTATGQTASHTYANSGSFTLTLTATDSSGVAVAATAVVTIGGGSSAGPRTVQLVQGCNNVALTFPDNTPTTTVGNGVSPASALLSVWKLYDPQNQKYHAFFPGATQATDLPSVNRLDAVFICVNAAATFTEPGA
ncbi:MAG: PKD domain-containing protein [Mycobacterium sp.]